MTSQTRARAIDALFYQNRYAPPSLHNYCPAAYVVGDKVFLCEKPATDWVKQTIGKSKIEIINYREAYEERRYRFANNHPIL